MKTNDFHGQTLAPVEAIPHKERPILFSAPMVQAILDGRKTQTRRILAALLAYEPRLCDPATSGFVYSRDFDKFIRASWDTQWKDYVGTDNNIYVDVFATTEDAVIAKWQKDAKTLESSASNALSALEQLRKEDKAQ